MCNNQKVYDDSGEGREMSKDIVTLYTVNTSLLKTELGESSTRQSAGKWMPTEPSIGEIPREKRRLAFP